MMIDQIQSDLKQAQLDRDEIKVSTLRMLISEIQNAKIAKGADLSDEEIISSVQKEAKKRRESVEAFKKGGRERLVLKEEAELKILSAYLPVQLSDEELTKLVEQAITETGASSIKDMGKVIGFVMSKAVGKADGLKVSAVVKSKIL